MINVKVNGTDRQWPAPINIRDMLRDMGMPPEGVAVAVNDEVIPRMKHDVTVVKDSDTVEIIHAVGGGAGKRRSITGKVRQ